MIDQLSSGAIGLGILVGAVFTGWQSWKARTTSERAEKHAQEGRAEATRAADNSHPISNGWGTALRSDMAAVRVTLERLNEQALLNERRQAGQDDRLLRLDDRVTSLERHPQVHVTTHHTTEAATA